MIRAYCDRCGDVIPADFSAGVRVVFGKREVSFHLCEKHMDEMSDTTAKFLLRPDIWRVVK